MRATGSDFLQLDPASAPGRGLTAWLADALRGGIIDGRLPTGSALPASRVLAADLGVSRGVVVEAYQRLKDEGMVGARHGAGTIVMAHPTAPTSRGVNVPSSPPEGAQWHIHPVTIPRRWRAGADIDLSPGVPDLAGFPRAAWLRAERAVLAQASAADLGYGDSRGSDRLRRELASWLARTRGLRAGPENMIIVTGVAQALALLAQWLRASGRTDVAIEDPGSRGTRDELAYWGLRPVPVDVDEQGLRVDELARSGARAAVLTPAHQFPTGVVLAPRRRRELLDWAAAADGLVIEDDYDAEYRYDRTPVPAIQASAPDRVAYAGSTSKTLAPGLRLGWLIPPRALLPDLAAAKHASDLGSPALPQLVLARLIATGELEQHIRLVRKRQRGRRDALLAAVREHLPQARVQGIAAGLHLLITFPELAGRVDDAELAERIGRAGVLVHPLSLHAFRPGVPGLVLGYAVHTTGQLHDAVRRIADAVEESAGRGRRSGSGALPVGTAVAAGGGTQLEDPRGPGEGDKQHTADGREQQGHAERQMAVGAKIGNAHGLAVLEDEDQQEQEHHREARDSHPQAADPGPVDLVLGQR
jgi:GntR family transcriptional regulator / MocR family aminotransferase